jgi:hypothetical protein
LDYLLLNVFSKKPHICIPSIQTIGVKGNLCHLLWKLCFLESTHEHCVNSASVNTVVWVWLTNLDFTQQKCAKRFYPNIIDMKTSSVEWRSLKGTVSRDYLTLFFFIKHLPLVPLNTPRKNFKFFWIFEELFEFVIDSPVYSSPGS